MKQVPTVFKEPLGVFTNPADFGETVMIDGKAVNAIFDREAMTDGGFGIAVANADPQIIVTEDDLPEDVKSVVVTVRGKRYTVAETDFDGCGMVVVQLRAIHDKPIY